MINKTSHSNPDYSFKTITKEKRNFKKFMVFS